MVHQVPGILRCRRKVLDISASVLADFTFSSMVALINMPATLADPELG